MDYITGEIGMQGEKFPWMERRRKCVELADIYEHADYPEYAERARTCGTWLQFLAQGDTRQLFGANFCQLRLCPMCIARRAKRAAWKLSEVMTRCQDTQGGQYIFLTLTVRNVEGEALGETLGQLTQAWDRLRKQRRVERAVLGWFRAVEITRNAVDGTYHPHIHAILHVSNDYFSPMKKIYLTHGEWVRRWAQALRVDYEPTVHIEKTRGSHGETVAVEAAKYATKDGDYISPYLTMDEAVEIVTDYTTALYRRRLTAYGGSLKTMAYLLDADDLEDGDLIHTEESRLRPDVETLILDYNWHFGAGDYVLKDVRDGNGIVE